MNWEEAIQLYVDYEASVLSDGKEKTALEKAKDLKKSIQFVFPKRTSIF
jgi:hypothetical protein